MKVSARDAAGILLRLDNYLVLTHRKPDGDTTGCACALTRALRQIGKRAVMLDNFEFPPRYGKFTDGLTVSDDEVAGDYTVVTVDTATADMIQLGAARFGGSVTLCIDHHSSNTYYAENTCVEPAFAACGELVFDVISAMGVVLDQAIAMPLYLAIATDTGCFRYANTSANSHRVTAALMDTGISVSELNYELFMLKSRKRLDLERMIMEKLEFYADGRVAVSYITREMIDSTAIDERETEDISCLTRQMEGVEVGITIRENPDRLGCKGSVRTSGLVDASRVCAVLGGGGHLRAGGFSCPGDLRGARDSILNALAGLYPELAR